MGGMGQIDDRPVTALGVKIYGDCPGITVLMVQLFR